MYAIKGHRFLVPCSAMIVATNLLGGCIPSDSPSEPGPEGPVDAIGGVDPATGVCCTDDGCLDATTASCTVVIGTYFDDEACGDAFSSCRGACCRNDECFVTGSKTECEGLGGEFKGPHNDCDNANICGDAPPDDTNDSEQFGICCDGTACVDIPLAECTGTVFFGADSCNDIDCTKGACCDTFIEDCYEASQSECDLSATGEFAGTGTTCADTNCNLGACCTFDGSACTDVTEDQCDTSGGAFKGVGTNCDRNQCLPVPCCSPDGSCADVVPESCRATGGAVLPAAKDCSDSPCSVGLCCSLFPSDEPFGDCRDEFTQRGCEARAGTFAGLGLTCAENTFDDVTPIAISAISDTPPTGTLGETHFTLNVTWAGSPTFPIRVQGYIDVDSCPSDVVCPAVSRRVDFRFDQADAKSVTIPDWNECPGLTTVTGYTEPWRFRIVDQHCVVSNTMPFLLQCTP